jgi:hypothetical protein
MSPWILACALMLGNPVEWEVTTGLGGLVWERPEADQPGLGSSNMVVWAHRRRLRGNWWIGGGAQFSAYDGREPEFIGPAFWLVDAMLYRRIDLGDWQLTVGAGLGVSLFHSDRVRESPVGDAPAGRYSLTMPGVLGGVHGALLRRLHPRLFLGFSLRYYTGFNRDSCWEGPSRDCGGVDAMTQHWAFGISVVLVEP